MVETQADTIAQSMPMHIRGVLQSRTSKSILKYNHKPAQISTLHEELAQKSARLAAADEERSAAERVTTQFRVQVETLHPVVTAAEAAREKVSVPFPGLLLLACRHSLRQPCNRNTNCRL